MPLFGLYTAVSPVNPLMRNKIACFACVDDMDIHVYSHATTM